MPREINRLSARKVAAISKKGRYADGGGLYLQVSAEGTKAWLFRFTLNGNARQMGLGALHTVSLADARQRALECRQLLLDGIDPIEDRKRRKLSTQLAAVKSKTFEWCARQYINAHEAGWRNDKHAAQWTSTLERYAYPVFGKIAVSDIDTNLVVQAIEPIWTMKTETASRVRGRIESILDWAATRGYRQGENPARWRGHLDKVLPARSKVQKTRHHAALPYTEAANFMAELRSIDAVAARGLEFLILTAARSGEVREATWREIDFDAAEWTIPDERMKGGREHVVPLSEDALDVLRRVHAARRSKYVFPGLRKKSPLSNMAFLQLLKRMKRSDLTAHGFRSTFRDWVAEQTAYPNEVAEMALAHAVSSKVEAAYRRGDLRDKRRRLMRDWAAFLSETRERRSAGVRLRQKSD